MKPDPPVTRILVGFVIWLKVAALVRLAVVFSFVRYQLMPNRASLAGDNPDSRISRGGMYSLPQFLDVEERLFAIR
jgi:hypothetical protein